MAELLIKAQSNNLPGAWEVGMIVEIKPDNYQWGALEGLPKFWLVKVPLIPVDHPFLVRLMQFQFIDDGVEEEDGVTPRRKVVGKRACLITQSLIDILNTKGVLVIKASPQYKGSYDYTIQQVKNYFWDKDLNNVVNIDL